ncbi:hypothetical protein E2C01_098640 [Portunus trituberculatus]|uniref:Uncharacterized protein n=1 Tax=Portunus trituberculatus TaxID=210409 RepID=A0A5B7KEN4_PORTR|nr:hypothetical protein [Portunus trituberculatus]
MRPQHLGHTTCPPPETRAALHHPAAVSGSAADNGRLLDMINRPRELHVGGEGQQKCLQKARNETPWLHTPPSRKPPWSNCHISQAITSLSSHPSAKQTIPVPRLAAKNDQAQETVMQILANARHREGEGGRRRR